MTLPTTLEPLRRFLDSGGELVADRYARRGYRSAFLDSICCLHLGPLTWEREEARRTNAYRLNREDQFSRIVGEQNISTDPKDVTPPDRRSRASPTDR